MAQALPLLALEPQVQELAQAAALVQVRELELVSAVEPLELVRAQQLELELVSAVEPPRVQEPAQRPELAAVPEQRQARELRVSRQLELQQHRLQAAAQELLPYLPALPMKAPC